MGQPAYVLPAISYVQAIAARLSAVAGGSAFSAGRAVDIHCHQLGIVFYYTACSGNIGIKYDNRN